MNRAATAQLLLSVLLAAPLSAHGTDAEFGDRVRAYLLENPRVILEAMEALATAEAASETAARIAAVAAPAFEDSHAILLGRADAPHRIVELFDYRCESCKAGHPALEAFVAANPDVAVLVQQLPILGPQSDRAARAVLVAFDLEGREAATALHEALFHFEGAISNAVLGSILKSGGLDPEAVEAAMHSPALDARIDAMKDAAIGLGVVGTPVFLTERAIHQGIATEDALAALADALRE